jgi:hypothetical protein
MPGELGAIPTFRKLSGCGARSYRKSDATPCPKVTSRTAVTVPTTRMAPMPTLVLRTVEPRTGHATSLISRIESRSRSRPRSRDRG